MLESQVSRVSDQESEKISTVTVLRTSDEATKFLSDLDNLGMSLSTVLLIAFEKHGARCHLIRIEAFNLDDEEFLGSLDEIIPHGVTLRLEGGSELELGVINKS